MNTNLTQEDNVGSSYSIEMASSDPHATSKQNELELMINKYQIHCKRLITFHYSNMYWHN